MTDNVNHRFLKIGWTETATGCWEWNGSRTTRRGGYGQIRGRGTVLKAHRVAYEVAHGPIPPGLLVLHSCDNPPCVNPAHLSLGSVKDNAADMVARGRGRHMVMTGGLSPSSKLTWQQAQEIRSSPESLATLARRYGVSKAALSKVRLGKTWKTPGSRESVNYQEGSQS